MSDFNALSLSHQRAIQDALTQMRQAQNVSNLSSQIQDQVLVKDQRASTGQQPGQGFGEILKASLIEEPRQSLFGAEKMLEVAAHDPRVSKLQFVAAITEAELELQKSVAAFTRAHEAYDKLMNMPV